MKRLFVLVACAVVLGGCASKKPVRTVYAPVKAAPAPDMVDAYGVPIERIAFRAGVSSVTVENMAKAEGCVGGQGAGLTSAPGPVETYRMICSSRRVFLARCEFRQCRSVAPAYAPPRSYAPAPVPQATAVVAAVPAGSAVTVPADSRVVVATVAAPRADSAPITEQSTVKHALTDHEVPNLVIRWNCGDCVVNDKVSPMITGAYVSAAVAKGYAISNSETAVMTITKYHQRPPAMRVMFGIFAGHDLLKTETSFGGATVVVNDSSANIMQGMNALAESVGRGTFKKLFLPK